MGKQMTMKRHFLTEDLKPALANIGYFTTKKFTLKHLLLITCLSLSALVASAQDYNNIEFVENKGQWDSRVHFMGTVSNGAVFLRSTGYTVVQHNAADMADYFDYKHGVNRGTGADKDPANRFIRSQSFDVDFVGASVNTKLQPDKPAAGYNNYFIGNDSSKWAGHCRIYQAVTIENLYPGIDARYYTDNGFLKYDLLVKPGADISKIALRYNGVDKIQVKNKQLSLSTPFGELTEGTPYSYQVLPTGKTEVTCKYVVKDNIVKFDVKGYDPTAMLIIDPSIVFCSLSGSVADNWGYTATYGPDGSFFGGGIVFGTGFPVSTGVYQTSFQGGNYDIGIIKLTPDGTNRVYATYLGGAGDEQPHSLICNPQGELIVAGRTNSGNTYPVINNGNVGGSDYDIVVTKLRADGSGIIGSRRIGGSGMDGVNISTARTLNSLHRNYGDDGRSEVNIDAAGNIYVAGCTQSGNFPTTAGAFQTSFGGGVQDAVVMKLNPTLSTILFSSFLGGSGNDAAYVLNVGAGGNIYVAGGTESGNMPGNTAGTVGASTHGGIDGFITVINSTGSAIVRTTYIGTNGADQIFGIQFDNSGFLYVMGQTTGTWVPVNATYSNAGGKQFIAKLQPDLSAVVYTTMFGSGDATPNISPTAFLVDRCENVYVSGWGGFYGPTNAYGSAGTFGLPVTPDAFKSTTDGKDFYFFVLKKNATGQLFGSFFGQADRPGEGCDHVDGGTSRFDKNGVIYQAICANCKSLSRPPRPTFPTTPGVWSPTNPSNAGGACNLGLLKIAMNLAGVGSGVQSAIGGVPRDTAGCLPLTVDFTDTIANGVSYEWHFNYVPGGPPDLTTTTPSASHTYNTVGYYTVMLVSIDPATCNVRDSSYLRIRVGDLKANLAFSPLKLPPCNSFIYQFNNNSTTDITRPFTDTSFVWDFGDGSPRVVGGLSSVTHTYPGPGTYTVRLVLKDTAYCNNPDSIKIDLAVAENVKASFQTPATGCVPYNINLDNTSLAGQTWLWDFGDLSPTSTSFEPTHQYTVPGVYTITLIAYNPNTCNKSDTARFTIQVFPKPVPDFSSSPVVPVANTPVTFSNLSSPDAVRFKWNFGDGDSLLTNSRNPVQHQYNATGTFTACLTAYNAVGCDSTICKPVNALIFPLVDVPNAFTPQTNDENSVVYVRGFGIAKMQFIIWNRWGQKVFETNNRKQGWDGKVKGVVQPMDVYVYTLSIEFFDGTKTTKKGDITLIR